jgi:hypothetical protein
MQLLVSSTAPMMRTACIPKFSTFTGLITYLFFFSFLSYLDRLLHKFALSCLLGCATIRSISVSVKDENIRSAGVEL